MVSTRPYLRISRKSGKPKATPGTARDSMIIRKTKV